MLAGRRFLVVEEIERIDGFVSIDSFESLEFFDHCSIALTPLQSGKPVQPQNALPSFFPLRAVRRVMALPHSGQTGALSCRALASTRRLVSFSRNPPSSLKVSPWVSNW